MNSNEESLKLDVHCYTIVTDNNVIDRSMRLTFCTTNLQLQLHTHIYIYIYIYLFIYVYRLKYLYGPALDKIFHRRAIYSYRAL